MRMKKNYIKKSGNYFTIVLIAIFCALFNSYSLNAEEWEASTTYCYEAEITNNTNCTLTVYCDENGGGWSSNDYYMWTLQPGQTFYATPSGGSNGYFEIFAFKPDGSFHSDWFSGTQQWGCNGTSLVWHYDFNASCSSCDPEPKCEYKVHYQNGGNSGWQAHCSVSADCGDDVILNALGTFDGWHFNWSGPGSFTQGTGHDIDQITLHDVDASDSGTYTAHWTDTQGCTGTLTMHLTVNGCCDPEPICEYKIGVNGTWGSYSVGCDVSLNCGNDVRLNAVGSFDGWQFKYWDDDV